MSHQK
jgi:seryl-tRNA synthetase